MKNKFIMSAAIVTALTMVTPSFASAAEVQSNVTSEFDSLEEVSSTSETSIETKSEEGTPTELSSETDMTTEETNDGTSQTEVESETEEAGKQAVFTTDDVDESVLSKASTEIRTGWFGKEDGYPDWCYKNQDGSWAYRQFIYTDWGTSYCNVNGYIVRGWQHIEGSWYYFDDNGYMLKDWQQIGGKWYYFDPYSGWMYHSNNYKIKGTEWTFAPSGQLVDGWTRDVYTDSDGEITSNWFYANPYGVAYTKGWLSYGENWYYVDPDDGYVYSDCRYEIDGKMYNFDRECKMTVGWYQTGVRVSDWYFSNSDGSAYDGWLLYNGSWYYFNDGYMYADTWVYNNTYYVGCDGRMVSGWYDCSYKTGKYSYSSWMYLNADGTKYQGWLSYNGNWYYINSEGHMVADCIQYCKESGNYYVFDANGIMITGWYHYVVTTGGTVTYDDWYYADSNGIAHDGWLSYNGLWYYIDYGVMDRYCYTPDGYWVGADGVWR